MQANIFYPSDDVLLLGQLNLVALTLDLCGMPCIDLRFVEQTLFSFINFHYFHTRFIISTLIRAETATAGL